MHEHFVAEITRALSSKRYLELGLYTGETFLRVEQIVNYAVGVDIEKRFDPQRGTIIVSRTDDFFSLNRDTFDFIFIDADHHFEAARLDLIHSLEVLEPYGVIAMHDTDPTQSELLNQDRCGDSYRVIDWIFETRDDLNVLTLPVGDPGLSIIQRKRDRRVNTVL